MSLCDMLLCSLALPSEWLLYACVYVSVQGTFWSSSLNCIACNLFCIECEFSFSLLCISCFLYVVTWSYPFTFNPIHDVVICHKNSGDCCNLTDAVSGFYTRTRTYVTSIIITHGACCIQNILRHCALFYDFTKEKQKIRIFVLLFISFFVFFLYCDPDQDKHLAYGWISCI